MSGNQTPDRFGGVREEEGLILTDEGVDPSSIGEIRNNGGTLKARDSVGVFDIRGGGSGGITLEDEGVTVPNGPHTTVNFTGPVEVTDEGSAEAKVALIFGSHAQDEESLGESQTTTEFPSYARKLRLSTPSIPEGRYRIGWSFEWLGENVSDYFYTRVQLDDSTDLMNMKCEPKDNKNWHPLAGFAYSDLSSGSHSIDIDYACQASIDPIHIRKARLEIWRVS